MPITYQSTVKNFDSDIKYIKPEHGLILHIIMVRPWEEKHMNKYIVILAVFVVSGCGKVNFDQMPSQETSTFKIQGGDDNLPVVQPPVDLEEGIDDEELLAKLTCIQPSGEAGVLVCHVPPGNHSALHTICIGRPALDAHLFNHDTAQDSHDYMGACRL